MFNNSMKTNYQNTNDEHHVPRQKGCSLAIGWVAAKWLAASEYTCRASNVGHSTSACGVVSAPSQLNLSIRSGGSRCFEQ